MLVVIRVDIAGNILQKDRNTGNAVGLFLCLFCIVIRAQLIGQLTAGKIQLVVRDLIISEQADDF